MQTSVKQVEAAVYKIVVVLFEFAVITGSAKLWGFLNFDLRFGELLFPLV